MKVKIADKIYDANDQPIMVILTNAERKQIADMDLNSQGKYCQYPEGMNRKEISEWMDKT